MANIKINPTDAIGYGKQIIQNSNSYNDQIKRIYDIVDDLKTTWTGSAAERFTKNIDSFREDYKKFGELINNFGELLVAIGKDYQDLESNL